MSRLVVTPDPDSDPLWSPTGRRRIGVTCATCGWAGVIQTRAGLYFRCRRCGLLQDWPATLAALAREYRALLSLRRQAAERRAARRAQRAARTAERPAKRNFVLRILDGEVGGSDES